MSKILHLKGEERLGRGKGAARALRRGKLVPATLYGGEKPQVMISLPEKELTLEYLKGGFMSHLIDITVGKHKYRVLPKQLQFHPVTDAIIHADFIHVAEHSQIKVLIPLHFINKEKCPGMKHGGVMNAIKHDLEVMCSADSIPDFIEIDIAALEIGGSIHIKDIVLPKGAVSTQDPSTTILTITGRSTADEKIEDTDSAS